MALQSARPARWPSGGVARASRKVAGSTPAAGKYFLRFLYSTFLVNFDVLIPTMMSVLISDQDFSLKISIKYEVIVIKQDRGRSL